jgi:tRNA-2-methylthio-N6-dimethylallyladenosine synthase
LRAIEGAIQPIFLGQVVGLDLGITRVSYFGIHFLREQFFRLNAFLLGCRFEQFLFDQIVERPFLNLVLLVAQRKKLPLDRRKQFILVDGLTGDCGHRLLRVRSVCGLRTACFGAENTAQEQYHGEVSALHARKYNPEIRSLLAQGWGSVPCVILALSMPADLQKEEAQKTFYLETFGCQMNVHDSERVIGTLISQGYRQVSTVEDAGLILYNTCSIRDKAEQKVFHRLADYKKLQAQGKKFGVLGCVAQQEGEKIFERAPHVSMVCGSASYRNLPQMLIQIEAGKRATGLDDRETDECFETEFTSRSNPHRGYITIIEGCDKFCAYCVVPFTRGKERSRTSDSVLAEARQMADLGYTEIQLLGQNVNSYKDPAGGSSVKKRSFAELLAAVAEVSGIKRVRFTTSHPRDFGRDIVQAIESVPTLCDHVHLPVQTGSTRVLDAMQRLYTRDQYLQRISWMKAAKREISITTDIIVGFPGETEAEFQETLSLLDEVQYDGIFGFKYSPRPNTPALKLEDPIPDAEKARRLTALQEKQRDIQMRKNASNLGRVFEVMVEGKNEARGQWIGRTSQNKVMNFKVPEGAIPTVGGYVSVVTTATFPNSLVGEMVI